jgi:hypothetical protein
MKITDYPAITKFTEDNVMLVDGNEGTKTITIADAIMAALHLMSPVNHRLAFRGKHLGSVVTTEQLAAIQAGTFEGLWLGDYWVINGINWRIADFDYWYGKGDTKCNKHHLVIMPDSSLFFGTMNSAGTAGGYVGSTMYTTSMAEIKATVAAAFGDSVISHREYLVNGVTSGRPTSMAWCDSTVEIPNEYMMYGHSHFRSADNTTGSGLTGTIDNTQLALFNAKPEYIYLKSAWLRDVVSAEKFAGIHENGGHFAYNADWEMGTRPVFAIG